MQTGIDGKPIVNGHNFVVAVLLYGLSFVSLALKVAMITYVVKWVWF